MFLAKNERNSFLVVHEIELLKPGPKMGNECHCNFGELRGPKVAVHATCEDLMIFFLSS